MCGVVFGTLMISNLRDLICEYNAQNILTLPSVPPTIIYTGICGSFGQSLMNCKPENIHREEERKKKKLIFKNILQIFKLSQTLIDIDDMI